MEVFATIHVPDERHLAQRVAIHRRGEVLRRLQLVGFVQRAAEVVIYHSDGVRGQHADRRLTVTGLQRDRKVTIDRIDYVN